MGKAVKVKKLGAGMSTGYQMDQTFAVWRILVGAVIIVAIYGLGLFGIGFFLNGMAGLDLTQSSQTTLIVFLASFIPIWLGTDAVTRVLFGFSLPYLYGRSGKIRWSDFRVAFVYIFVIVLLLELLVLAATWVMGALLFGLAHLDPITYGFNSVLYVLNTAVTGVILCFITLWRGNIAMAMGIHFAVNIFAILIIGQGDTPIGSGAALWLSTIAPKSVTLGLSMIVITVVEIALYFIWARRRYGALIPSEAK
ncbi:MAG: CPBP family intramembrane metalloprotease [Rhodobacteraceae bacterium]|nr:CPBP family intramembrane metalloprotease [Paracoccaceae bacterium]